MGNSLLYATLGTLFTFLMTPAGATVVFFFKDKPSKNMTISFTGFVAGDNDLCHSRRTNTRINFR